MNLIENPEQMQNNNLVPKPIKTLETIAMIAFMLFVVGYVISYINNLMGAAIMIIGISVSLPCIIIVMMMASRK